VEFFWIQFLFVHLWQSEPRHGGEECVMPMEITYMDTEDKYKYMVSKIHIFKVHIFKLHILYLKITKIHIFKSIEVSDFFLVLA
jgi:hypothetical protein